MEELDKQPKETPEEIASLADYTPDERILILMRRFLGDNQNKAEYKSRIKLFRDFITAPNNHLDDPRLIEINSVLAELGQTIIREKFFKKNLMTLLLPRVNLISLDRNLAHTKIFSRLSLRDLEKYATASDAARKQVNEYYESFFTQAKLSEIPDKEKIFRLIQEHKIEELKLFLFSLSQMNRLSLALFEPIGVFDPLLYLKIYGHQDVLNTIYSTMTVWIKARDRDVDYGNQIIRIQILTGQKIGPEVREMLHGASDDWMQSIVVLACEHEHREAVDMLCAGNPHNPLRKFINKRDIANVRKLVESGANPANNFADLPYMGQMNFYEYAIYCRANTIAKYLIDQSMAHILAKDGNRGRVFAVACAAHNNEMLRYLCEKTKGNPGVVNIIKGGSEGAIHNWTALQHACYSGNVVAVGLLLDMNFPVDVVSNPAEEVSVLFFACRYADTNKAAMLKIIQLILAKNSTLSFINANDRFGRTALLMADASGNREVIELLRQRVGAAFTFGHAVNSVQIIRHTVHDIDTLKTIPIDLLERYVKKNPKHKIAEHLLNVLTRVEGVPPLTWGEKLYLNIGLFFSTELGLIYDLSLDFCPPEKKISEAVPLLAEDNSKRGDNTESVVPKSTPQAQSQPTKTVREQLGFGPPQEVEEEKMHEKQVGGVSGELESVKPVEPFEDEVAYFDRRMPSQTPPPSPQPQHSGDIKNDNNAKSPKKY